ncbi:hypothetical protein EYF80_009042 [Liparis tanakae]|uniref:Uncharacterized protein n=1 Tax=Liparis tanakae TaxID=230148 RepID=A0A4Z2IS75_9TELE|nr:hypothetical protein EYF80_009042 [Liparis tanakae]
MCSQLWDLSPGTGQARFPEVLIGAVNKRVQTAVEVFHLLQLERKPVALSREQKTMRMKGRKIQMEKAQRMQKTVVHLPEENLTDEENLTVGVN